MERRGPGSRAMVGERQGGKSSGTHCLYAAVCWHNWRAAGRVSERECVVAREQADSLEHMRDTMQSQQASPTVISVETARDNLECVQRRPLYRDGCVCGGRGVEVCIATLPLGRGPLTLLSGFPIGLRH